MLLFFGHPQTPKGRALSPSFEWQGSNSDDQNIVVARIKRMARIQFLVVQKCRGWTQLKHSEVNTY